LVLEKKIFKWPHPIFTFLQLSPLWRGLNKTESPHPRIICIKFDWIWLAGSGEDFKKFSVYFYTFTIIFPWRRAIAFISTNLTPTPPRWSVPSLVKIGPVVLEKKSKM
jgi:hypothetical protein